MREWMILLGIVLVLGFFAGPAAAVWAALLGILAVALFGERA
jgi:hypothetical protein